MRTRGIDLVTSSRFLAGVSIALLAVGCRGAEDESSPAHEEVAEIAAALEQENGGLTMDDEQPMFAEDNVFEAVVDPESPVTDELASASEVIAIEAKPGAARFEALVMWGQIPADFTNETPHTWNGKIRVSRGALLVRKTIRFEDKTDGLLPREDLQEVAFTSRTRPANDGLRLTILDPTPLAPEPLTLTYETEEGLIYSGSIDALVDGPESVDVDDAGNRFVGVALATPDDPCQFGMLGGRWHRVAEGRGRLAGRVTNAVGDPVGHLRGIYGTRQNGNHVFFGKYIDMDGHFRGIFAGHYDAGAFHGKWIHAAGEVGKLGGHYWDTIPGPEKGGKFIGRWAETTCNINVDAN